MKAAAQPLVKLLREPWADLAIVLPVYATAGAAGADIRANLPVETRRVGLVLAPMQRAVVPTGLRMEIPAGFEVQIRARSGLAAKHGISIVNGLGTVDSDYRGPIGVLLINLGAEPFTVSHGDRIAQLVVSPVVRAQFEAAHSLNDTARGGGGFGSTGRR